MTREITYSVQRDFVRGEIGRNVMTQIVPPKVVAGRHNVVLVRMTDSSENDLSMFGATWGPDIEALHIQAVALRYLDGDRRTLPEAANAFRTSMSGTPIAGDIATIYLVEKSSVINFAIKFQHKGTAFIRHGATSMKRTPSEIQAMLEARIAQQRMV